MSFSDGLVVAMFASFVLLIFTGYPVAWVLGGLAVFFTAIAVIAEVDFGVATGADWAYASLSVDRIWDLMNNWVLVALPMFIFMGLMLDRSGVATDLMTNFARLFGRVRGGLAVTVTVIGVLLAASTGIIGASVVLLTLLGLPIMLERGYRAELAAGTVAAVGTLGILIPPSIMLVMMADRLAISVGDLFLGALVPGVMLGVLYVIYILGYAALRPKAAPLGDDVEVIDASVVVGVMKAVAPALGLVVAVLGSIFFGIATPTEASGVGALGASLLAWGKGRLDREVLREVLRATSKTTGFIFAILIAATAYSLVLRGLGGDAFISQALLGLPFGPEGIVLTILLFTFLLGFFLDWIEITLIVLPLVAPVVTELGFDIVWFTVLFAVCLQTSFLTPPVGFALFYLKGVAPPEVRLSTIYRGVLPFIVLQLIGLMLIFRWPAIALWLPSISYGGAPR
ncbi:MAG: TRAP transporter large permease subunit [Myxococcota bacterium]|nr:TRAP transporter large permease subunit [Myxococcota bacterium]